jgi:cold-inducible RNA-binding protein
MKNIFVSNLDITTTEDELRNLFRAHGTVETVTLVRDRDTSIPRGFAFVEMSSDTEAEAAIVALNGTVLADRPLTVNEARPKAGTQATQGTEAVDLRKKPRHGLATRNHRRHQY